MDKILEILRAQVDARIDRDDIEVVPDRQILSLYAVRVDNGRDYLVHTDAEAVEKVRFDEWPPS